MSQVALYARVSPTDDLIAAVRRREVVSAGVVTKLDRMNRGPPFVVVSSTLPASRASNRDQDRAAMGLSRQ